MLIYLFIKVFIWLYRDQAKFNTIIKKDSLSDAFISILKGVEKITFF